ncbi:hypothetical protein [Azospirillum thermophilum]|uniref:hypothetical protein n=1 Tax=Azospirillum thermophilum TaxID=2202148 RepID=UPI00143D09F5|nr:hypothetical protein [Azospirillum thermophilum]
MKNPVMSLWLSWANRATSMMTAATMSAAKRNQAALLKSMTTPPKSKTGAKRRTRASKR